MAKVILTKEGFRPSGPTTDSGSVSEVAMKTQGEIEAVICQGISRFEQDYMGRGPKEIHTFLLGNFLVVRLQGVLTAAEQQLVQALPAEKGRDLLKQVRTHLIETARRGGRYLHSGRAARFPRYKEEIVHLTRGG